MSSAIICSFLAAFSSTARNISAAREVLSFMAGPEITIKLEILNLLVYSLIAVNKCIYFTSA